MRRASRSFTKAEPQAPLRDWQTRKARPTVCGTGFRRITLLLVNTQWTQRTSPKPRHYLAKIQGIAHPLSLVASHPLCPLIVKGVRPYFHKGPAGFIIPTEFSHLDLVSLRLHVPHLPVLPRYPLSEYLSPPSFQVQEPRLLSSGGHLWAGRYFGTGPSVLGKTPIFGSTLGLRPLREPSSGDGRGASVDYAVFESCWGPDGQRSFLTCMRIIPVPVRAANLVLLHHPLPSSHVVAALIIEAHEHELRFPRGHGRGSPSVHGLPTIWTSWPLFLHLRTPL